MSFENALNNFCELALKYPGIITDSLTLNPEAKSKHVVFSSIIHGNEIGSIPGVVSAVKKISSNNQYEDIKITFILGNKNAALQNMRYIERDLNRSFDTESTDTAEHKRAKEIEKILNTADIFIDFHQTIMPSQSPFYIFPFHAQSYYWARTIHASKNLVTRSQGESFSPLGKCSDEYCHKRDIPAITIELGQAGINSETTQSVEDIIFKTLDAASLIVKNHKIEDLSSKSEEIDIYLIKKRLKFEKRDVRLKEGFYNFCPIRSGELIGKDEDTQESIFSEMTGYTLFPAYPEKKGDGYYNPKKFDTLLHIVQKSDDFLFEHLP